mgnify:CR=1 FL=1
MRTLRLSALAICFDMNCLLYSDAPETRAAIPAPDLISDYTFSGNKTVNLR